MTGARRRSKRRRGASSGGADLISGLGDDVLVQILELLPDAVDAVRTGVLSRRWRGLWTRANSLIFDSSSGGASIDQRFLDFVNNALAQRAKQTDAALDLEHLAISFGIMSRDQKTKPLVLQSADAASEWIRYAIQKRVKSFFLELQLPTLNWNCRQTVMDLSELASSSKLETMYWKLKGVRLQLPATAVFTSLVDLSLQDIDLVAGGGHLLARLLSSACCPSLQKLQLWNLGLLELNELLIESSALLDLSMSSIPGPATLKLKTPSLQILHIQDCDDYLTTLGIFAPRLEEVTFLPHQPDHIDVDGELPCVRSLKVGLYSHGDGDEDDDINNGGICLLQCCTSLTCLEVSLEIPLDISLEEEHLVPDIISGRIPHFPHLISLTVYVGSSDLHSFGFGLSEILKQCSCLKYLSVHYTIDTPELYDDDDDFACDHPDHNKSHQVCLANIEEVWFTGLAGIECENYFIQGVLAHATQLQKVSLSFDLGFKQHNNMIDCPTLIPCGSGTWACHDPSYEWNSH